MNKESLQKMIDWTPAEKFGYYDNLHSKPPACLYFQSIHFRIFHLSIPVSLCACIIDSYILQSIHSLVSCITFFAFCLPLCLLFSFCSSVNLQRPSSHAWRTLVFWVHHSRFDTWLLYLLLSRWRTTGRLLGFGIYVIATNLLTLQFFISQSFHKISLKYLAISGFLNLALWINQYGHRLFSCIQTLPSSVMAYNHSYHGISFINRIKKIVYRMRYSTLGTLSSVCCNIREYYNNNLYNSNIYG